MKKRKLKGFVLPTLYLLITITIFTGVILLGSDYEFATKEYDYTTEILDKNIVPVMNEEEVSINVIQSPVENGKASITVHYYSSKDNEETQKNSLIYYEDTYMPNTGVLYTSDEAFNVMSAFDGKVVDIKDDEFFSKVVVIEHNNNLKTYYYGLQDITVAVSDELNAGDVIGISKNNEIMNNKESFLFEVYYNNELMNPEKFIGTKITDYN